MIIERDLNNGFVLRKSDKDVYIRNKVTGQEDAQFINLKNEERVKFGLVAFEYEETNNKIL